MKELALEIAAQEDVVSQLDSRTAKHAEESAKLAEMKAQLAAMEAQETITNQFENLDFGDGMIVSLREACANEEYYQLLSMWIQTYIGDQAQKHAAIVNSYKSEISAQEEAIIDLTAEVDRLNEQIDEFTESIASASRLQLVIDDLTAKRDSAGVQLAEAKEENERLTKDNESLRKQLEGQNAPATPQVDPAELFRRIQAAKPGIYNKRWYINERGLEDRRYFAANLSTTGEEITIPLLEIGKYREESPEEAERFRQEKTAEEAAKLAENLTHQDIEVPSFQGEEDAGVPTNTVSGEVAGQDDEIRIRLERLERAVFGEVKEVA
ncbi:hypothetical protein [Paenibacillus agaridevorans]|uniref:hypothetical protein n=1 Tax=Paenibacillus agaridevorans TaxID=171404 RepID=UPI001BE484B5|nr:hypothetical protein [Paenibacillus agaridevorans]